MPLAPGDVFAGYTVVRQIGTGGMGAVYLVRHPRLPRFDALKLLRSELSSDPDFARRFLREADVVAGLSHRNIVSVLDRGEDEGQLWLTMQYVDGIDAEQALLDAGGLLPAERVAHILTEVAGALDAAHRQHLIHRDVKPANILLAKSTDDDEAEQVFLTDFGIAKSLEAGNTRLTRTGAVVATFDYASPEQIESRSPDARSDVYSLGCVLYKLLTGSVPFPGPGVAAAIHGHLQLPPPRPTALVPWLAPGIDDVVARAMAKDPAERFPTCRALAAAAAAALGDFPVPPEPPYTVTLTRPATGAALGPMTTDRLSRAETDRIVDLVRRTRFFDLPENLHAVAGRTTTGHRPHGGRPVTLEIRSGRQVRRVEADLDEARRPHTLDALVEAIEHLPPPADHAPEPATVLHDLRGARPAMTASAAPVSPAVPRPAAGPAGPTPAPVPVPVQPERRPDRAAPAVPTPAGPFGPGGPGTPWTPAAPGPPGGGRGRVLLVLAVVLVLVAAGVVAWLVTRGGGDPPADGGGTASNTTDTGSASQSTISGGTSPPEQALQALPRAAALAPTKLVVPRDVGGNVDLYLVDAETGETKGQLTTAGEDDLGPILLPDRQGVVYIRKTDSGDELRVVATDGSGDRPLFETPVAGCGAPSRPAWNPAEPTQLAITCNDDPAATALLLVTLDGAVVRTLETGLPVVDDLTFSPDGTSVAFWGGQSGAAAGNIYTLPVDGSAGPQQLTDSGADNDVVWSSTGRLAFARSVGGGVRQIHVMDANGSNVAAVTSGGYADQGPVWSPDGTLIAFKSSRPAPGASSGDHYWVVPADGGGEPRSIDTEGVVVSTAAWGHR